MVSAVSPCRLTLRRSRTVRLCGFAGTKYALVPNLKTADPSRTYEGQLALQLVVTFRCLMRFCVTARRQLILVQLPISKVETVFASVTAGYSLVLA